MVLNRKVLVDTNVAWPNGLSLDWQEQELYWTDARADRIQAIGIDGRNRRTVVTDLPHPYGVTVQGKWIYWTDWETKSLNRTQKKSHGTIYSMREGLAGLMDIKALPGPAAGDNVCGDHNGKCSHLCLRNPDGYSCACPTGLTMMKVSTHLVEVAVSVQETDGSLSAGCFCYLYRVVSLKNMSHPWTILSPGDVTPDGLAVDWLADNIYWTDAGDKAVKVARLDGTSQKTIINSQLLEPRAIAVFPSDGWLEACHFGIEMTRSMSLRYRDDQKRVTSVCHKPVTRGARTVTSITLAEPGWSAARHWWYQEGHWRGTGGNRTAKRVSGGAIAVTSVSQRVLGRALVNNCQCHKYQKSVNGGVKMAIIRRIIVYNRCHNGYERVTGGPRIATTVSTLGNHIYWTDWDTLTIERADKTSGSNRKVIRSGIEGIMEIMAVTKTSQEVESCEIARRCPNLASTTQRGAAAPVRTTSTPPAQNGLLSSPSPADISLGVPGSSQFTFPADTHSRVPGSSKFTFNLLILTRVFQGLLSSPSPADTSLACSRVFSVHLHLLIPHSSVPGSNEGSHIFTFPGPFLKIPLESGRSDESSRKHYGHKKNGGTTSEDPPGLIPLLAVLALVLVVSVLAMMAVVAWWKYKKQTKMVEGPKGGALTYTNPTYSASNSDVNTDRKPFTWRRLHHEANHQGRMFEEKGEVAALISEGSSVEHESPPPTPPTRPDPVT
nr:low-density lipoprotein receptor-related protein 4-like [Cherax quadricarinatus]